MVAGPQFKAVSAMIKEAMETLKMLPIPWPESQMFGGLRSAWPEVQRETRKMDYADETTREPRLTATTEQIARLTKVQGWLMLLTDDERLTVTMREEGLSWRAVMRARRRKNRDKRTHEGHRFVYQRAIKKIMRHVARGRPASSTLFLVRSMS